MEKITSGETYRDRTFDGEDFRAIDATECVFIHCSFIGSDLTDSKCNGALFEDCNLQDAKVGGANFFDTQFVGSKLSGVDFSNKTKILATVFNNCIVDYSNFSAVDLSSLLFERCSCIEVNFSKANLKKTVFANCLIQDAVFGGSHFEQTDLHTSILSGVNLYEDKVRGVILSSQQFLALASEIGVTIV